MQWAHLVIESSVDAIIGMTLDGLIQSWNTGAAALFGYEPEEMLGRSVLTIVPTELHAQEFQLLGRIRAGDLIEHFDTTRQTKDGRRVPISLTLSPIRDVRGVVIGASKIARDISRRRLTERLVAGEVEALAKLSELSSRLWRSRSLSEGLDEMLGAVIALLSADKGNIQLLDSDTQRLRIVVHKGFQQDFLDAFHEVSVEDPAACGRALRSGERTIIEDTELDLAFEPLRSMARAAGYRAVVSTPLLGADGTRLGVVSTHFRAVHRPTAQELRRLDLYLRQASDFIQRNQMEETLRKSQEALLEADHRKDEFLALLAHELRNPLAPLRYALAMSKSPACTPARRAHAEEVMERQLAHMSRLLDDLLDISRITMGKLELKKQETELNAVLNAAIEAARPSLEAKGHTLSIEVPTKPLWLLADPVRLAQVFSNLLINAAKYTNAGGRVYLRASFAGEEITVRVGDNGIGIARETLPRLFTPFFQGDAVSWRSEGGLGLGLSLVRGVVMLHGGSVEAFSDGAEQGSEFVVRLPCTKHTMQRAKRDHTQNARTGRDWRVLLVDDNRDAADTCASLLELSGQQVRTAYSGRAALELAETFRPHMVVLDIGLPDLDGYVVAENIRSTTWGNATLLVAVTGWGREDDRKRAFAAGFNHHLTKPITAEALESLLHSLSESPSHSTRHSRAGGDQPEQQR